MRVRLRLCLITLWSAAAAPVRPYNPERATPAGLHTPGLGSSAFSPLLAESLLISLPEGTEMFHFPSFAARNLSVFSSGLYRLPR